MNEMYSMSVETHYFGVIGLLLVILGNLWMLKSASVLADYKRQMRIYTPMGSTMIGAIIFTGVVMMASKHLNFTIENIIMILFAVAIIVLEAKRAKTLKYLNPKEDGALEGFKKYAMNILLYETILTITISLWMWM